MDKPLQPLSGGVDASRNREIRPYTHSLSLVDALVDAFSRFITLLLHYISEGISGSTSDKKMCTTHGHLEWMKTMVNDVDASNGKPHNPIILADKGFCNVEPEYNAVGVFLARTARKIHKPFTDCDIVQARLTSNLRVHVERASWCLKVMAYVRNQKKVTRIDMLSREVRNMMRLRVNYGRSLIYPNNPFSSTNVI